VTRIFLVDDHPIVRTGVRALLRRGGRMEVVGEADSGEAALELVPRLQPDVALIDLSLGEMGGIELARRLHSCAPKIRLVALSMHEEADVVKDFFEAGGVGYVPKSSVETQLVDAVAAVIRGEFYTPPNLLGALAQRASLDTLRVQAPLSRREREVVRRIALGSTYREIAEELRISEKTVATYRERAAEKLGVQHRVGLVRWAFEQGLLVG
jgi:DNA-binding NarL/FixJ family response regulator